MKNVGKLNLYKQTYSVKNAQKTYLSNNTNLLFVILDKSHGIIKKKSVLSVYLELFRLHLPPKIVKNTVQSIFRDTRLHFFLKVSD